MRKIVIALLLLPSFAFASPYFDTATYDSDNDFTITVGCSAPNLVVANVTSGTDNVTGVTVGGVTATKVSNSAHMINRYAMMYYAVDVPSGVNALVVTGGSASGAESSMASYCGLGVADGAGFAVSDNVSTNYSHAYTSSADAWYVMLGTNSAIYATDGTNCTRRTTGNRDGWLCDSGALLTAGSNSQTVNGGAATWGIVQGAFVEVATSTEETDVATTTPDTTTKGDLGLIGLILLTFAWYYFIVHLHGKFFPVK